MMKRCLMNPTIEELVTTLMQAKEQTSPDTRVGVHGCSGVQVRIGPDGVSLVGDDHCEHTDWEDKP